MTQIDPAVRALRIRIMDAGLKASAVRDEAEVGRATWYRMCKGDDFAMSTLRRMEAAVDRLIAARIRERNRLASAPAAPPPNEAGTRGPSSLPIDGPQAGR